MLRMLGIPVADPDVDWLIDALHLERNLASQDAHAAVKNAAAADQEIVALTPEQRLAILSVLDDAPDGLVELRGALASDLSRGG